MNTISLGGVSLNGALVIAERETSYSVEQTIKRTLGGNLKVFHAKLTKGQALTLTADEEQGWLTGAMVTAILAMSEVPGGQYTLLVNGVASSVIFRHNEAPAFVATPLVYRNNQQGTDYFTCTIKLLTV